MNILGIFDDIAATKKQTEKVAIMEGLKQDLHLCKLFKLVCKMTYDPSYVYYIKDVEIPNELPTPCVSLGDALYEVANCLGTGMFRGNMAKEWLNEMFLNLTDSDAIVVQRVIKGDLRCGISAKTINKVFPNLIYDHPFQRCSSFSEKNLKKIKFPCYSQTKMDGMYADFIFDEHGAVEVRSRNGQILGWVDTTMFNRRNGNVIRVTDSVLMGELVGLEEDGTFMPREKSNGYVNSDDVDPKRVAFIVWDLVGLSEFKGTNKKTPVQYHERFSLARELVDNLNHERVLLVRNNVVESVDDVVAHFREERELGNEGTIIKNLDAVWKNGTSSDQVKIKVVFDCEMKAVAWKFGTGQFEGMLGAITFESSDGEISVSVGSGYKQEEREQWVSEVQSWVDSGRVAKIRANDVTQTETGMSLFLPRFVEWRTDKNEADTRNMIFEQAKSFVDALKMIN